MIDDIAGRESSDGFERLRLDYDRVRRTGLPEVVYAERKTPEDTLAAMRGLFARQGFALATRVPPEHFAELQAALGAAAVFDLEARAIRLGTMPPTNGRVAVVCAGTSDVPVAEEAAFVLEAFGHAVVRRRDVGVAGLHRLLRDFDEIAACDVAIVVAGMEGALPSVVAGLVACAVIAVPTSVGYGAAFGGLAALLGMLTSCAPGIAVVNIDNGFGAAALAHKMLRQNPKDDNS